MSAVNEQQAQRYKEEGNQRFKAGQYREAITSYTNAITSSPSDPTMYGNRSAAWFMLKAYGECVGDCEAALSLDGSFVKARQRMSKALTQLGDFRKAKEQIIIILESVSSSPDEKETMRSEATRLDSLVSDLARANKLLDEGDYAAAISIFRRLEQEAPACDDLILKEARANLHLDNYAQVIRDCLQIIKREPSNSEAYLLRAKALYLMENYDQAVAHLQECLRMNPDDPAAAKEMKKVRVLVRSMKAAEEAVFVRNFEDAVKCYTEALEVDKDNGRLNGKLLASRAESKYRMNDLDGSLVDCKAALRLSGDLTSAYITMANVCMNMQKYEEAVTTLEHVLKNVDPNSTLAMQRLQDAQFELKKSRRKNYYGILGVMTVASTLEIRDAYKKAAMEWHPDKHASESEEEKKKAEQMFKDIQEAHEVLTDPFKRDLFDKGHDLEAINEQAKMREMREKKANASASKGGGCGHDCNCHS